MYLENEENEYYESYDVKDSDYLLFEGLNPSTDYILTFYEEINYELLNEEDIIEEDISREPKVLYQKSFKTLSEDALNREGFVEAYFEEDILYCYLGIEELEEKDYYTLEVLNNNHRLYIYEGSEYQESFEISLPDVDKVTISLSINGEMIYITHVEKIVEEDIYHNVYFVDEEGNIYYSSSILEGDIPNYPLSDLPSKEGDEEGFYIFNGWDIEFSPIYEDTTYVATFIRYDYIYQEYSYSLDYETGEYSVVITYTNEYDNSIETKEVESSHLVINEEEAYIEFSDPLHYDRIDIELTYNGFSYQAIKNEDTDEMEMEIIDYINPENDYEEIIIPDTFLGIPVTQMVSFNSEILMTQTRSFTLGNNIKEIPSNYFESWTNLEHIDLKNVETIYDYAFYNTPKLLEIMIPNTVTYLGESIISGELTYLKLPINDKITTLSTGFFSDLSMMIDLVVGENLLKAVSYALSDIGQRGNVYFYGDEETASAIKEQMNEEFDPEGSGTSEPIDLDLYYYLEDEPPNQESLWWHFNSLGRPQIWGVITFNFIVYTPNGEMYLHETYLINGDQASLYDAHEQGLIDTMVDTEEYHILGWSTSISSNDIVDENTQFSLNTNFFTVWK